jgi:hypothetical protein
MGEFNEITVRSRRAQSQSEFDHPVNLLTRSMVWTMLLMDDITS